MNDLNPLSLPQGARTAPYRWVPFPRVATGIAWVLTGIALAGFYLAPSRMDPLARVLWPCVAVSVIAGGVGLLLGATWGRFVIAPGAAVMGLFVAVISVTAPYPFHLWWWIGPLFVIFAIWTFALITKLWGDFRQP